MNNFTLCNVDTDAISICKPDGTQFSEDEKTSLLQQLNDKFINEIKFTDDGYFQKFIVLKTKNYIMKDAKGKVKQKGSSLKSSTLEPAVKAFLDEIIQALLNDQTNYTEIYQKYIRLASNVSDMKPWAKKLTLSEKTFNSPRANETKVIDAIRGSSYKEGDRVYIYFMEDESLSLVENFNGQYDKFKLYEKLFKATKRFETILPVKDLFTNYCLKKKREELNALLESFST